MESSNQARQRTNVAKEKTEKSAAKATSSPKQSSPKTVKKYAVVKLIYQESITLVTTALKHRIT